MSWGPSPHPACVLKAAHQSPTTLCIWAHSAFLKPRGHHLVQITGIRGTISCLILQAQTDLRNHNDPKACLPEVKRAVSAASDQLHWYRTRPPYVAYSWAWENPQTTQTAMHRTASLGKCVNYIKVSPSIWFCKVACALSSTVLVQILSHGHFSPWEQ